MQSGNKAFGPAYLELLPTESATEQTYRTDWRQRLAVASDLDAVQELTNRARAALLGFAIERKLLQENAFIDRLVVLPTPRCIFRNIIINAEERFVVSQGYIDMLTFHHRATVVFRMSDKIAERTTYQAGGSRVTRTQLYMAHLDLLGRWMCEQFTLDDLPAAAVSPTLMNEEANVFLLGFLFLLLHERAHGELDHRAQVKGAVDIAPFAAVTPEELDEEKKQELEADAWAAGALSWPSGQVDWSISAVVRLFLLFGLGQAANGRIPRSHPYVSNRLSHLIAVLEGRGMKAGPNQTHSGVWLAGEYDRWKQSRKVDLPSMDIIRAIGMLSVEAATRWRDNGGDAAFL